VAAVMVTPMGGTLSLKAFYVYIESIV
jgi:hypothetical protein